MTLARAEEALLAERRPVFAAHAEHRTALFCRERVAAERDTAVGDEASTDSVPAGSALFGAASGSVRTCAGDPAVVAACDDEVERAVSR